MLWFVSQTFALKSFPRASLTPLYCNLAQTFGMPAETSAAKANLENHEQCPMIW